MKPFLVKHAKLPSKCIIPFLMQNLVDCRGVKVSLYFVRLVSHHNAVRVP